MVHWRPTWRRAVGSSAELRSTPWCGTPHEASASLDLSDSTHNTGTCADRTTCSQTCRRCMTTLTLGKYSDWLHAAEAHLVAALDAAGALSHAARTLRLQMQAARLMLTESRVLDGAASWQDTWRNSGQLSAAVLEHASSAHQHLEGRASGAAALPRSLLHGLCGSTSNMLLRSCSSRCSSCTARGRSVLMSSNTGGRDRMAGLWAAIAAISSSSAAASSVASRTTSALSWQSCVQCRLSA